ncbi:MAG: glutamate formimidoyltransferase [Bryobacteraceae bacterium]
MTRNLLVECVPNFSEGRSVEIVDAIEAGIRSVHGSVVLHRTSDRDHNRSVITYAGLGSAVLESALEAARIASSSIDLRRHRGVHPRLGALDVLPFVPLADTPMEYCVGLAHEVGRRLWEELGIPVYFYEAAAQKPERIRLEHVRRGEFEGIGEAAESDPSRRPDIGGPRLHPTAGAVIVGARKFLIAYNINLRTADVSVAKTIAKSIRTSSGGFPAVKALGLALPSRGLVQVSMNLTDFEQTPVHVVFLEVARLAAHYQVEVEESELIGLMPRKAIEMAAAGLLKLHDFHSDRVVENRLESALIR